MRHIRTSFNHWSSVGNKTSFNWKSWVTVNLQYFAHWLCLYQDQNIQSAEALRHPVYKFSPFIYIGANRSYLTTIFVIIHFQSPATGRVASEHVNRSAPVTRRGSSAEWCLLLTHRMCCMFTEPNGARRVCVMLTKGKRCVRVGPRGCQHVQTGATLLRLVYIPETNNRKLAGISLSSLCRCSSFTPEVFSEMILNLQHKPKVERK